MYLKTLIPKVNLDPRRVEMVNLSAAMGPRWAEICTEFTEKIKQLGPSPLGTAGQNRAVKERKI